MPTLTTYLGIHITSVKDLLGTHPRTHTCRAASIRQPPRGGTTGYLIEFAREVEIDELNALRVYIYPTRVCLSV